MSTRTITHVTCDRQGCGARWHFTPADITAQQRQAVAAGWQTSEDWTRDYCPKHADRNPARAPRP